MLEDNEDHLPKLRNTLQLMHFAPSVPDAVDARIAVMAQHHLRARRRRLRFAWATGGVAVAASVLVALLMIPKASNPRPVAMDIDGSSQIDIVDAFQLAHRITLHSTSPQDDLNHDGKIDQADVDLIAQRAVKLPGKVEVR